MSSNPGRSRLAELARLSRRAEAAAAAGRVEEAAALYEEAVRLDARDRRTLHRLGDFHRLHLHRLDKAAFYYEAEARCEEQEGFAARAAAAWRLVLRCDPLRFEALEHIGQLYLDLGRAEDARRHFEESARTLTEAGRTADAAILRARLAAVQEPAVASAVPAPSRPAEPDATAADLAGDRLRNARLYHRYGLPGQARGQLEDLLKSLPEHLEARQLLVEVCRALGDDAAAGEHLRVATWLLCRLGSVEGLSHVALELPPVEEWEPDEPEDPMAGLVDEIRQDVERLVDRLEKKGGGR